MYSVSRPFPERTQISNQQTRKKIDLIKGHEMYLSTEDSNGSSSSNDEGPSEEIQSISRIESLF
jgi:hypothetical protein